MKITNGSFRGRCIFIIALATTCVGGQNASAVTYTVINTNPSGGGSLIAAVTASNSNPTPDTIDFNIPGPGPHTIVLAGQLEIGDSVVIDGYTQPGSSQNTLAVGNNAVLQIVIDCSFNTLPQSVFQIGAPLTDHVLVRGLVINNAPGNGGSSYVSMGCPATLQGCFIGTDPTGVSIVGSIGNAVQTNGTDTSVLIGGSAPAERNVIGGSISTHVDLSGTKIRVLGNYIGVNAQGTSALGATQQLYSVVVGNSHGNTVGGSGPGEGNVIAPGKRAALHVGRRVTIQGNYIGTDATGSFDIADGSMENYGVWFEGSQGSNSIVDDNLISGFAIAAYVNSAARLTFTGNYIGTNSLGQPTFVNGTGIFISGSAADSTRIGGVLPGDGNVIAGNADGIYIGSNPHRYVSILGNSIWGNTPGLGIDLTPTGVTANDAGDGDAGPNNLQNFPVLTEAMSGPNISKVTGTLNSTPNTQFHVEYFYNPSCHASGHGEGQAFLNVDTVITDGSGNVDLLFFGPGVVVDGFITATATDPNGNTSEFAACQIVLLDTDEDGVANINDNCPEVANGGQEDGDGDNIGDVCDEYRITVYSPVDIVVYSPDNADSIGIGFNTFGAMASYDDQTDYGIGANGVPGEADDRVVLLAPVEGVYRIKIISEPGGSGDYFLGIRDPGGNSRGVAEGGQEQFVGFTGGSIFLSDVAVPNPVPSEGQPILAQAAISSSLRRGDLNADANYDVLDVVETINHAFRSKPLPDPDFIADVNSDGTAATVLDVVRIIETVFRGKPVPGP